MFERNKILVAYFSWSGNTQKIAKKLHQIVGGDIIEIKPSKDYPENYNLVLDIAKEEIRLGSTPELKSKPTSIEEYDSIFIGYPNWWNTFPAPISTFLSEYNFTKKTIIPFCTHGGGGIGQSQDDIRKYCPETEILEVFSIKGKRARYANFKIKRWLKKVLKMNRN